MPIDYSKWDKVAAEVDSSGDEDEDGGEELGTAGAKRAALSASLKSLGESRPKSKFFCIPWETHSEKVRWALDRHGHGYVEHGYPWPLHLIAALPFSDPIPSLQHTSVPILETGENEVYKRSTTDILLFLFARAFPSKLRIYGETESLDIEQYVERELLPAATYICFSAILSSPHLTEKYLFNTIHLQTLQSVFRIAFPLIRPLLAAHYLSMFHPEQVGRTEAKSDNGTKSSSSSSSSSSSIFSTAIASLWQSSLLPFVSPESDPDKLTASIQKVDEVFEHLSTILKTPPVPREAKHDDNDENDGKAARRRPQQQQQQQQQQQHQRKPRVYLAGDQFTAADIAFAAHATYVLFPSKDDHGSKLGISVPTLAEVASLTLQPHGGGITKQMKSITSKNSNDGDSGGSTFSNASTLSLSSSASAACGTLADHVRRWRSTVAGQHALKMYHKERGVSCGSKPSKYAKSAQPWWADHTRLTSCIYGGLVAQSLLCAGFFAVWPMWLAIVMSLLISSGILGFVVYLVWPHRQYLHQLWFLAFGTPVVPPKSNHKDPETSSAPSTAAKQD